jgi:hypothetical protein
MIQRWAQELGMMNQQLSNAAKLKEKDAQLFLIEAR